MIALVGDAELDEGNVYECLQEGWKQNLRNTWWIIDYNRQSLDGVVREGLWQRIEAIFRGFGWDVVILKYGALQRAAFAEPGDEDVDADVLAVAQRLRRGEHYDAHQDEADDFIGPDRRAVEEVAHHHRPGDQAERSEHPRSLV